MVTSGELRVELDKADAAIDAALAVWKDEQSADLAAFLDAEARITALDQAAHTEAIVEQVPALRERLATARDQAVALFGVWADQYDEPLRDLRHNFMAATRDFTGPWTDEMRGVGYRGTESRARQDIGPWAFYNPSTGSARNASVPASSTLTTLEEALSLRTAIASQLKRATESEQRRRAADIWGD